MRRLLVTLSLLVCASAAFSQTLVLTGGDFSAATQTSSIPAVIGYGAPPTLTCAFPTHKGRMYARLDATTVAASLYVCLETSSGSGTFQWTVQTGAGSMAFSSLTSGTNTAAAMVIGTGASLAPTDATHGSISANKLNGTSLAGLGTGLLKNTTTTGVPSIAAASDVTALFSGCSGTQYLGADGACHSNIQIPATTTDPVCTAAGDIGKFWFDTTTTTTSVKICVNVSGTVEWGEVTHTP